MLIVLRILRSPLTWRIAVAVLLVIAREQTKKK